MRVIEDLRIPGRSEYVYTHANRLVKVPDEIRKSVAFVAYEGTEGLALGGTVFFIGDPIKDTDRQVLWVVTAAHVINRVRAKSVDQLVRIRLNKRTGGTGWMLTAASDWTVHDTEDVAALSIDWPRDEFEYIFFRLTDANTATDEVIEREAIGVGDEVFLTGLFANHPGLEQDIPIVRVGNIAAMPSEPISLKDWGKMVAYLVEARSVGGLSGSPVFVHHGIVKIQDGKLVTASSATGVFRLLGLMHGHFDGGLVEADTPVNHIDRERVNMGIAVVVPIKRVLEVIRSLAILAQIDVVRQDWIDAHAAVAD